VLLFEIALLINHHVRNIQKLYMRPCEGSLERDIHVFAWPRGTAFERN
jgi:hypothetical protein